MPVVPVDYEDLVGLLGKRIPKDELVDRVPMMGGAYDGEKDGRLLFEFFPNRPDLLSVEGLARATRAFLDLEPGLKAYEIESGDEVVHVDASVRRLRPHIGFARVDGLSINEALLEGLIDLQERLTAGPGRKRRKVAIGIHDADPVKGPYKYIGARLDEHAFVPLQMTQELTPKEVLERHEKGQRYRHLVEGHKRVPLILDRDDQVLSMPPVINGQLTALSTNTRNVLVDVTGMEERATMGVLGIVVAALAERGGRLRSVQIHHVVGGKTRSIETPRFAPQRRNLSTRRVQTLLGIRPTLEETQTYLARMGHRATRATASSLIVESPAWRLDLLHEDDLVEDVAIGYGFERFTPRLSNQAHFGGLHERTKRARRARTALLGLGFTEAVTLTITSRADVEDRIGAPRAALVEVENPVTSEHAVLRPNLYTGLLALLRANKHRELPQALFEVGLVVAPQQGTAWANELRLAGVRAAPRATFADCKGLVEALTRDLAMDGRLVAANVPGFIDGRCAALERGGTRVGFFGEFHPKALHAFDLRTPAFGFEFAL